MCSRTPPASTVTTWGGTWRWSLAGATRRPARTTGGRVDGSAVGTLRPRRRAPRRRDPPVARPAAPPDQRLATTGPGDGPVGGRYPRAAGTGRHWRPAGHHSVGRAALVPDAVRPGHPDHRLPEPRRQSTPGPRRADHARP